VHFVGLFLSSLPNKSYVLHFDYFTVSCYTFEDSNYIIMKSTKPKTINF